jgi:putative ABC transport system permease protein
MLTIPEHPPLPEGQHEFALVRAADPEFFRTMEIPLLRGRFFSEAERLERSQYIIINQSLAREFFPNEDPIGKHIRTDRGGTDEDLEIVGIVGDTLFSVKQILRPRRPMMYFPMLSGLPDTAHATLVIRAATNARSLALPVQKEIAALDPELPIRRILTMEEIIGRSIGDSSFSASLALVFAGLSLLLAAVGLYGVLSYLVTQRTTEIGIRIALGARRDEVMGRMLLDGLRPAFLGLVIGITASLAVGGFIRSLLYGVQPADPLVFVSVIGTLLIVAALACAVPAWRASRLDPMQALRTE